MALELASHFVAFIDILGFSEMVREDCESSAGPKHVNVLYEAHLRAAATLGKDLESGLIQFSDSIVFSRPFDLSALASFVAAVAVWQKSLLVEGLLCRGGITFGKHFVKDRFMFSKGLIDAYRLESTYAKVPRIAVSDDLLQLASTSVDLQQLKLLREEDSVTFVDYLGYESEQECGALAAAVDGIIKKAKGGASVMEKMRWLARYADYRLDTKLSSPQFAKP